MRRAAFLAFTAAALLLMSGCLSGRGNDSDKRAPISGLTPTQIDARLSQPVFKQILYEEASVDGTNGTKLWLDVYRPGDDHESVPVILVMTPYRALSDAENTQCTDFPRQKCPYLPDLVSFYVPRGYAVAFADSPGNHNSGGCFDNAGPETGRAGYRVVEWLAGRSWSNGRVGMYGASYDAQTQIATAVLAPPHLVTIIPVAAPASAYEFLYYDGVPFLLRDQHMPAYAAISAIPGQDASAASSYPGRLECQPENVLMGHGTTGDWNAYWQARDLQPLAANVRASVLESLGFQDTTVRPNAMDEFWNNLTSTKRLVVGQWDHGDPTRRDWPFIVHRWLDQYLKGIDTGLLQDMPTVLAQDRQGNWTALDSFPPLRSNFTTFYLASDGALSLAPAADGKLAIEDYPRSGAEGLALEIAPAPPALGTPLVPDRLLFTSAPLAEDLHIVGQPLIHIVASTSATSTHWAAILYDADAAPQQVGGSAVFLNHGAADTRHRFGLDHPQDIKPGEDYNVTIRLFPSDDVIPKGHRIRIEINNDDPLFAQDTTFATSMLMLGVNGTYAAFPEMPSDARPIPGPGG